MVLDDIRAGCRAGVRGFVLTGNLQDLALAPGLPPARLPAVLAGALAREGYLPVFVSRSLGLHLLEDETESQRNRRDEEWVRQVSRVQGSAAGATRGEGPTHDDANDLLAGVGRLLRQSQRRVVVLVDFAQHFAPNTPHGMASVATLEQQIALEHLVRWGHDERVQAAGNLLLLLGAEGAVHDLLVESGGYRLLRVGLPAPEDRRRLLALLAGLGSTRPQEFAPLDPDLSAEQAAALAAGLRLSDLEGLSRAAAAAGQKLDAEAIRREKSSLIAQRCGDLLEVLEPTVRLSRLAGIPHVRDYLLELVTRLRAGSSDVPRAVLLMGVPGVGKTYVVGALAAELGWNCLVMRSILSKWVGESERNLEKAFGMVEDMKPCVFFIDEVDQALVKRGEGGDAGTSQRMLKRSLEFLAEERHRGSVLFVAATNAPHMLDPAIDDRFGVKLPFLHPTPAERAQLLPAVAGQIGRAIEPDVAARQALQAGLDHSTVRGMLEVVAMAGHLQDIDSRADRVISSQALQAAAEAYLPTSNPFQHEYIALIALRKTTFSFFYPWLRRDGMQVTRREGYEPPPYVRPLLLPNGRIDAAKLNARIHELGQLMQMEASLGRF